jgi:hypothetical protein
MNLYLVSGEEILHPDIAPYRAHIVLAVSEAVARELVEKKRFISKCPMSNS